MQSGDEKFWESAFIIRMATPTKPTSGDVPVEDDPPDQKQNEETSCHGADRCPDNLSARFLQPVLKEMLMAGKSMELLEQLGKLRTVLGQKCSKTEDCEC